MVVEGRRQIDGVGGVNDEGVVRRHVERRRPVVNADQSTSEYMHADMMTPTAMYR